jgi:hypothetical protein
VFIVAMTMIMLSSLNADPLTLFSSAKRAAQPTDWLRAGGGSAHRRHLCRIYWRYGLD